MLEHGDCQGCPDAPTIFLSQIVDGELRTYNLCRDCPHMDEVDDPAGCALVDMLLKISHAPKAQEDEPDDDLEAMPDEDELFTAEDPEEPVDPQAAPARPAAASRACECGMTRETLEKSQRVGCPACYETFRQALTPLLRGSQTRGERHRGKMPASLRQGVTLNPAELEDELAEAIRVEDFERAAHLRDLLRQLGQSLRG